MILQYISMNNKKQTFDEYFSQIYQNRWPNLKKSLSFHQQIMRSCFGQPTPTAKSQRLGFPCYDPDIHFQDRTKDFYVMDPASAICAQSLDISEGDFVLDMCAAPGGKSLILLEKLRSGILWSNEISSARRMKLKSVIQQHVPKDLRKNIFIKGKDGMKYGLQFSETFDKVLVDAPCSGEKHLIQNSKEAQKWSLKRTQRLSKTQFGLLCSAILATKPGGSILYSTCSISPLENDGVIGRAIERKSNLIELDLPDLNIPSIERTEFGYLFLPDYSQAGPIYFSRLKKK